MAMGRGLRGWTDGLAAGAAGGKLWAEIEGSRIYALQPLPRHAGQSGAEQELGGGFRYSSYLDVVLEVLEPFLGVDLPIAAETRRHEVAVAWCYAQRLVTYAVAATSVSLRRLPSPLWGLGCRTCRLPRGCLPQAVVGCHMPLCPSGSLVPSILTYVVFLVRHVVVVAAVVCANWLSVETFVLSRRPKRVYEFKLLC